MTDQTYKFDSVLDYWAYYFDQLHNEGVKMNKAELTEEVLLDRRSVFPKEFDEGQVSRREIEMILNVARYAPTHKHTEPWRFVVIGGEHLSELAELQGRALFEKKSVSEETKKKAEKFRINAQRSSAVIAIVMKRDSLERIPVHEEEWAVACAVQNIQVMASQMQIGMYWSTGAAVDFPEIRADLKLSPNDRHMGWLYLGRFEGKKPLNKERMSLAEVAEFRW